jgi:Na+-translocating ferredoxin:NAD+ oxidoreductase RNF subunit RnfB
MLTPILIVVAIGLVCAAILTIASKVFFVPVDETFANLRAELPGANCGACGYNGCDDYANALAEDHSLSCSLCPVGGADVAAKLAEVLGVEAGSADKEVAVVMCNGHANAAKTIMEYKGVQTCSAAKQFFGGMSACPHGCIGLGDCEAACDFDAIHICDGVAVVNRENCVGCGVCAKTCPNSVIKIQTAKNLVVVQCKNTDKGAVARKACKAACIGCGKCAKICPFGAITVENNVAYIDFTKCKLCTKCVAECPTGAIHAVNFPPKPAKPAAPAPAPATEAKPVEPVAAPEVKPAENN